MMRVLIYIGILYLIYMYVYRPVCNDLASFVCVPSQVRVMQEAILALEKRLKRLETVRARLYTIPYIIYVCVNRSSCPPHLSGLYVCLPFECLNV